MKSLIRRSITGVAFLIIVIGALLWQYTYSLLILAIIAICSYEYLSMTIREGYKGEKKLSICAGMVFFALAFAIIKGVLDPKFILLAILPYIAICAMLLFKKELIKDKKEDKSAALFAPLLYVVIPFSASLFLTFGGDGAYSGWLMLGVFILIWFNDVGAYIFGMSFGQRENSRKLAPEISPKKSIAGLWGGTIVTLVAAVVLWLVGLFEFNIWHCLAIGVIVSIFDVMGDLFESLLKRHYMVKDSGSIMPGHGGLLDRFDGTLFVIPVVVIYLKMFSLI